MTKKQKRETEWKESLKMTKAEKRKVRKFEKLAHRWDMKRDKYEDLMRKAEDKSSYFAHKASEVGE